MSKPAFTMTLEVTPEQVELMGAILYHKNPLTWEQITQEWVDYCRRMLNEQGE